MEGWLSESRVHPHEEVYVHKLSNNRLVTFFICISINKSLRCDILLQQFNIQRLKQCSFLFSKYKSKINIQIYNPYSSRYINSMFLSMIKNDLILISSKKKKKYREICFKVL
jgi:hypothetical protein